MPFQGLKKEINNIIFKFEETIKGLCAPLIIQEIQNEVEESIY